MPLKPVLELLNAARDGGYAVGYFESWSLESLQGVVDAAEESESPMIIGFNGEFMSHPDRSAKERVGWYAALSRAAAESSCAPLGLIFNECARDDWIRDAIDAGFSQVMLDDPGADYDNLVQRLRVLADYAHARGAAIEGGLDELPRGASGTVDPGSGATTDPAAAARFVEQTTIDILSISVGNVHVLINGQRELDVAAVESIRNKVDVHLDLHGGSGIPAESLRAVIPLGVTKVCYGTYIKQRYLDTVRKALGHDEPNPHRLLGMGGRDDVLVAGRHAVRDAVLERIDVLGCSGRGRLKGAGLATGQLA